jgi:hypothetical protein
MLSPECNPVPPPLQVSATRHAAEAVLLECLSSRTPESARIHAAICTLTDVLRTEGMAPEAMLVAIKATLRRVPHTRWEDPIAHEERHARLIQWSIENYFRDVDGAPCA